MSNHRKITRADLVRAMGQNPATFVVPSSPTPEEFLAKPLVALFQYDFQPIGIAYSPLDFWFGGRGAAYLAEWRARNGPKRDRTAFCEWLRFMVVGNPARGFGCDALDLSQPDDRIRLAVAIGSVDHSHVPLAAEYLRIHCREEGALGWTPPTGEERLGAYRAQVEEVRRRARCAGPCLVTRGLPASHASPALARAVREATEAARSSGLVFDLLVFDPMAGAADPLQVSHLYVAGTPESVNSAAEAGTSEEARDRIAAAGGYSLRLYGEVGAERRMEDKIVQGLGWVRDQAALHHTPVMGMIAM